MKKIILGVMIIVSSFLFGEDNLTLPTESVNGAFDAASSAMIKGPSDISIMSQATLKLPANFAFIPKDEAIKMLEEMGNGSDNSVEGIIFSLDKLEEGFFVISYIGAGYIKDDDALSWDADDLLTSLKDGTEYLNQERVQMGIPEIEVLGWITPPTYDMDSHKLVWSAQMTQKGAGANEANGINYNTYVLGREGYITLNLVTDAQYIDGLKPVAHELLEAMTFDTGKQYGDFNENTDHVAEYGLAALVAGVAAKKLGFIALIVAFVIKFAKFIGLGLAGVWYFMRGRKEA
jgi:uncharacterized membrane-anchored protein